MKILYIVAGANGSGKSTFAKAFAYKEGLAFLNADELASKYGSHIEAGKRFFELLHRWIEEGNSFIIESTLSGKYLLCYIQEAKKREYKIIVLYIFLESPKLNILRVKHRVLLGGHDVAKEDIIRRFYRSKKLFWQLYRQKADEWYLYDNSEEIFELVADNEMVYDQEKFEEFLKDIE